ncbi:MFS transporter [Actinomadura rupiterrae]|uniref:MFS transporter n=1 Tax=Actinomadura rupiterrae TaxID=559627 RepID=UPI0020A60132|nr:MFS transporter [Actinomadura rupiterrae]MCP2335765.1 AAHS family benzoate transporter-like MFS transporter [Actinomadura rupiterrae]
MTATLAPPATRMRTGMLALACLVLFIDGYDLFALGTIGPSLLHDRSWGAHPSTLGTLGSVTAAGMPFGSILAGWSADRWGRRVPLALSVGWISVSMLATALAGDLTQLGAGRFCTGIGIGALAPLVSALVSDGAPAGRRTLHLAVALGSIGVGGTASALLGRFLLPEHGFQSIFWIGVVPVVLVPLIWVMVPAGRPQHARPEATRHETTRVGAARDAWRAVAELFSPSARRGTVLLWLATFMSMALVYSTTAWLPTVMMRSGYNLGSSLEFMIAFSVGASAGGLVVSLLADRGHLKLVTLGTFVLAALALLTLSSNQPRPLLLAVSALAGLGSLGCQNMIIACMSAFYPPHLRGTGLGVGLGAGRIGAIVGPSYLSAATAMASSPRTGFVAFMIPAVLGAAIVALLPRTLSPGPE